MADCNDLFQKFLGEIAITKGQNENLQRGRDATRENIENHFSETMKVKKPEFFMQGSYALKTMIKPLNPADEYDLDDGVYLKHLGNDMSKWPTSQTASNWIVEAVKGHTKKKPENKKSCVRVVYVEGYHIDLPVYCESNGIIYLARLGDDQWVSSDAKAFNKWFYDRLEKTEQIRSCIKYLKAWKDFCGVDIKGIHLTVLVGVNHIAVEGKDDMSLAETVAQVIKYLEDKRAIYNPLDETENLIADWTPKKLDETIKALKYLQEKAADALSEDGKEKAAKLWQMVFGDRFKFDEEENDRDIKRIAPPIVESKPWSCL